MFTPLQTTIGAVLLHISTTRLLFDAGAILGASGLLRQLLKYPHDEVVGRTTRLWFFSGMTFGTTLIALLAPASLPTYPSASGGGVETAFRIFASALLTGWGTKVRPQCPVASQFEPTNEKGAALRWLYIRTHAVWYWATQPKVFPSDCNFLSSGSDNLPPQQSNLEDCCVSIQ